MPGPTGHSLGPCAPTRPSSLFTSLAGSPLTCRSRFGFRLSFILLLVGIFSIVYSRTAPEIPPKAVIGHRVHHGCRHQKRHLKHAEGKLQHHVRQSGERTHSVTLVISLKF